MATGSMVIGLMAFGLTGVTSADAASSVPYSDPNAVGYIGLCNQAGQQITSGSVSTTPFAWRAVSSEPAQPPYNNAYRTAILLAYQPQQGLAPGEWSGEGLTASARYTNPNNPMAAATSGDDSLADFIQDFSPKWDGFLELRMYLGTENAQAYSLHYPALNIQVNGNTWTAVGGGQVNCQSGTAESIESIVLPTTTTTTVPPTTTVPVRSTTTTSTSKKAVSNKPSGKVSQANANTADHPSTNNDALIVGIVLAALVVLAAAGFLLTLRKRRSSQLPSTESPSLPEKGPKP